MKKIRAIQLKTRRILSGSMVGDSRTAKKGFGLEFEQLAEYQFGDDIRFIDWKSSARTNKLLLKEYREERNRVVMLVVDGSRSNFYASGDRLKYEVIAEVASIIALAAQNGKDAVGLILVTDKVELYIPPKNGRKHSNIIMEALFNFKPQSLGTNIAAGLKKLMQIKSRDMFCFLISDFIDAHLEKDMRAASQYHELVALHVQDSFEQALPDVGFLELVDLESETKLVVNTNAETPNRYLAKHQDLLTKTFKNNNIKHMVIKPDQDYLYPLIKFLIRR
ncbi:MAG: DUF58 domain-containing protein [Candidatus Babeliales bacterium]